MNEEAVLALTGALCFFVGFLVRGELQWLKKRTSEKPQRGDM